MRTLLLTILFTALLTSCGQAVLPGDAQPEQYLPLLRDRKVAVYSNHTGVVDGRHLVDILLENGIRVSAIFSPEHGFRGKADAGAGVSDSVDPETGVPILSLYGPGGDVRPSTEAMASFDVLVVDIQDVGLRFYTYYITLCHLMDACGEADKEVVILDRPNPNGHYVDGPILDPMLKSGVGHLPIPVVHGLTLGELIKPDCVHILNDGKIVLTGDYSLAKKIEKDGFNFDNIMSNVNDGCDNNE